MTPSPQVTGMTDAEREALEAGAEALTNLVMLNKESSPYREKLDDNRRMVECAATLRSLAARLSSDKGE
jgi:hypothetical protein